MIASWLCLNGKDLDRALFLLRLCGKTCFVYFICGSHGEFTHQKKQQKYFIKSLVLIITLQLNLLSLVQDVFLLQLPSNPNITETEISFQSNQNFLCNPGQKLILRVCNWNPFPFQSCLVLVIRLFYAFSL